MESRVNALEDCFKETEKRLDAVDKKVDTAFQEAEVIKTEGEGCTCITFHKFHCLEPIYFE